MDALIALVQETLNDPPLPFNPDRQSLKAWAMYCLRDRGFKVLTGVSGDFAVETRSRQRVTFQVTEDPNPTPGDMAWIICDRAQNTIRILPPTT